MAKVREILVVGGTVISGSNFFETTHRDMVMALLCMGFPFLRVDVEDKRTLVFIFDEDRICQKQSLLLTGDTSEIAVPIRDVWAADKTWNMVYSLFRDRYVSPRS